ncbi:MAG: hypothetical protein JOZ69_01350 [Myxococcales bacterium]|nr:hypothetical protein [Myxococcales bacterium]
MKTNVTDDDLLAIQLLARDAITAGEQAGHARQAGAKADADSFEAERRQAVAQIYRLLGVKPPLSDGAESPA